MINIIYTCEPTWEESWLEDVVFKDVEYKLHVDPKFKTVLQDSVIVMNETSAARIQDYIDKFNEKGYRFGVIHLSDEAYKHPVNHYRSAVFVLRNYYSAVYENLGHVEFFPLGYKKGFKVNPGYTQASAREYKWNFVGQVVGKPTREPMINAMAEIDGGYLYVTRCWDDPMGLSVEEYQDCIENSTFTACPAGWINPDSFRVCEALEAGSIPIVDSTSYFQNLSGGPVPFITISKWKDVEKAIADAGNVDELQDKCRQWWELQKFKANNTFKACVAKLLNDPDGRVPAVGGDGVEK